MGGTDQALTDMIAAFFDTWVKDARSSDPRVKGAAWALFRWARKCPEAFPLVAYAAHAVDRHPEEVLDGLMARAKREHD